MKVEIVLDYTPSDDETVGGAYTPIDFVAGNRHTAQTISNMLIYSMEDCHKQRLLAQGNLAFDPSDYDMKKSRIKLWLEKVFIPTRRGPAFNKSLVVPFLSGHKLTMTIVE